LVQIEPVPAKSGETAIRATLRLTAIEYDIPVGCAAAYYPEANVLIALDHCDPASGTPSYKSIPVHVRRATALSETQRPF
jgi:anaerobic selenocysteine-containing dehydrogenase